MDDEEEVVALQGAKEVKEFVNEAALNVKLQELTGGADMNSDSAWLESLAVTAEEPLDLADAEDDLKRELALCAACPSFVCTVTAYGWDSGRA
jgi:hypothetical protein